MSQKALRVARALLDECACGHPKEILPPYKWNSGGWCNCNTFISPLEEGVMSALAQRVAAALLDECACGHSRELHATHGTHDCLAWTTEGVQLMSGGAVDRATIRAPHKWNRTGWCSCSDFTPLGLEEEGPSQGRKARSRRR